VINVPALDRFLRRQSLYIAAAVAVGAVFWANGQEINLPTILAYALSIGNLINPPIRRLQFLYERPFPYDWLIFLALLLVLTPPVYVLTSVLVWWLAAPSPGTLSHLIFNGWKFPCLVILVFGVIEFLYRSTKTRLERRNVELQRKVELSAERLELQEEELERAREIQESLLPKEIPQLPGFEVAAVWHPARAVGGDYFDVLRLDDHRLAFCIADVVGKGVSAALLMANVQAAVRAFASDAKSPAWLCSRVNSVLCGNIASDKFVTFFYGVLDTAARRLEYCNAGHLSPLLVSSGSVLPLPHGGAVLGVFPTWEYQDAAVELESGDRLMLFTDGITEASAADGEEFGDDRVASFAQAHRTSSAAELNHRLLAEATRFCDGHFQDDATILVIAVN
jgi:sigma-B regulation protein RsbU (phosphoserine phosphatase)